MINVTIYVIGLQVFIDINFYENFFHQENLSLRSLLFFSDKILKLHTALKTVTTKSSPHTQPRDTPSLNSFAPATEAEISKIILNSSSTFCDLDPIPTSHLKQCLPTLLSTLTNIINLFLATCFSWSIIQVLRKHNLVRRTYLTTDLYRIFHSFSNLQKE